MKPGLEFENNGMKLVCLAFFSLGKRNVGLFRRVSDGMYITARNTSKETNGSYSWAWEHYFKELEEAEKDCLARCEEMVQDTYLAIPNISICLIIRMQY